MKCHMILPIAVELVFEAETRAEMMELFNAHAADLKFALRHETYTVLVPEFLKVTPA